MRRALTLAGVAVEAATAVGCQLNRYSLAGLVSRCPADLSEEDQAEWMKEHLIPVATDQFIDTSRLSES